METHKKMSDSNRSFLSVLVWVLSGAFFATGAVIVHSWQNRDSEPVSQSIVYQQEAPAPYLAR